MLPGAHAFVAIVYGIMAGSFVATTTMLAIEFHQDSRWVDFLAMDSHLFVFFPVFGVIALLAFYLPSVAFVDHYWRHVPYGKLRFILGLIAAVILSHFFSQMILSGENRSMWELTPDALATDRGEPPGCAGSGDPAACERLPVLVAINSLRKLSQQRLGVGEFVPQCDRDPLIEPTKEERAKRYCVANTPFPEQLDRSVIGNLSKPIEQSLDIDTSGIRLMRDQPCCIAQQGLVRTINGLYRADPDNRSFTGQLHARLLPLKVFFLLTLLAISLLLTLRFKGIATHYATKLNRIEIGVIVGTIAALFFPLMSQAFLQSLSVIFGTAGQGAFSTMVPVLSLMFGLWTLLIVLFFFRRNGDKVEQIAKIGSALAGGVALVKYDVIVSFLVRIMGSGASWFFLSILLVMALAIVFVLIRVLVSAPSDVSDAPEAGTGG